MLFATEHHVFNICPDRDETVALRQKNDSVGLLPLPYRPAVFFCPVDPMPLYPVCRPDHAQLLRIDRKLSEDGPGGLQISR